MNRLAFSRKLLSVKSPSGWASRSSLHLSRSLLGALLALSVLGAGCASPQRSGAERTTFLGMATTTAAITGGFGTAAVCRFARYGLSHHTPDADAKDYACLLGGALLAGGAALYGSAEADREPETAQWVVFSMGTALAVVGLGAWIVDAID